MRTLLALLLLALVGGCASPLITPLTPAPATPAISPVAQSGTEVISIVPPMSVTAHPGDTITLDVEFHPILYLQGTTTAGQGYASQRPLESSSAREMRVCYGLDAPCTPSGDWVSFSTEYNLPLTVDWLGPKTIHVNAEFRDANKNAVPTLTQLQPTPDQITTAVDSVMDTRTPLAAQPAFAQTAVAATRVAYPITGSLVLQNGMCCAGGKVGSIIQISAAFDASGPAGPITEMRVLNHCGAQDEMDQAAWEPFAPEKQFPYQITVANWVGWYLAVQYRDAQGNLSPIYCADISVEGMQ